MKKKNRMCIYQFIFTAFVLTFTNSCLKENNTNTTPILTTNEVNDITLTSATCGGNITSDGGTIITARGVCWNTGQTPTIADSKTSDGTGTGSFISSITALETNTNYYVRAYATNTAGTGYGNELIFKTYTGIITDIDGNVYYTITIGTQEWMTENLKTTSFRNGDLIPNVTDNTAWSNLRTGAYCDYDNILSISSTYGKLYNWYVVVDLRNLCPSGWHVPTDAEWTTLTTYLGGENGSGGKLKETGTTHFISPNTGATNETGFSALPGGYRSDNGTFGQVGYSCYWWSSTEYSTGGSAWYRNVSYIGNSVGRSNYNKQGGYSVRCLRN
jgi:uncharacterized protein (TIGR02145 family)